MYMVKFYASKMCFSLNVSKLFYFKSKLSKINWKRKFCYSTLGELKFLNRKWIQIYFQM